MAEEQETPAFLLSLLIGFCVMSEPLRAATGTVLPVKKTGSRMRVGMRPTAAQRRYLSRGLEQPGGKLPIFDGQGREIDRKTVESCVERGWAERWFANPMKPDWLVCKLTPAGYVLLGRGPSEARA
jgi:hypothetical protein